MPKKLSGWITAAVCLLLIIALYFLAPVHPIGAGEVTYASATYIDNCINLNEMQVERLNALLADMTAKRCFAPANITEDESTLMVDMTTNDGAKHIIFNDEGYLYSSADDAIWYRIDNADQLRSYIEILLIAEY